MANGPAGVGGTDDLRRAVVKVCGLQQPRLNPIMLRKQMLLDVELLKELDAALPSEVPSGTLWHYTSVGSAKAILEGRAINLGCHAFMNDPAEGTVAGSIVTDCWRAAVDACPSHPRLNLSYIRDASSTLSYFDFGRRELPPTFLFSLTELRDSLSQWSRYGDNGAGIALGFAVHPTELPAKSQSPWRTGTQLLRVDYDDPSAEPAIGTVRPIVRRLLDTYVHRFLDPTDIENTLIALIHRLNPLVKRGAYVEEREWRIIDRTVVDSKELYAIGCNRFGIAPYVPISFGQGVTLVELMLGPKLSRDNLWSAKWMCEQFGHDPQILASALAYR